MRLCFAHPEPAVELVTELLTDVMSCAVLPAIACLEGHNIASIHSKRFRSRLDTGDPNAFADYRFGCCCYLEDEPIRRVSSVPLSLPFISLAFSLGGPLFFGGAYRESLSLICPLYVEGTSLSTSLRYQDLDNSASFF
jgi:hypothetical protein